MRNSLRQELKNLSEGKKTAKGEEYFSLSHELLIRFSLEHKLGLREVEMEALKMEIVPERYQRNLGTIGIEGQIKLLDSRVAVVGAGGLGGMALELLARFGVGRITLVDSDFFQDSNLNRQILSHSKNLGKKKVEEASRRISLINPALELKIFDLLVDEGNLPSLLEDCQVAVDGLDNIQTRFILEKVCKKKGIPLVHGAIAGFMGQVTTIFPEDEGLRLIYGSEETKAIGIESQLGTPCLTPVAVASWQVSEVVKILLGWDPTLRNRLLFFDMKKGIIEFIDLG